MSINADYLNDKKYTPKYFTRKNVCRLCWKISKSAISIEDDLPLAQFITENLGISVKGHIMQSVCNSCTNKLYTFINFKKFCLEADLKLTNILSPVGPLKRKIKVENETKDAQACKLKIPKIKAEPTDTHENVTKVKSTEKEADKIKDTKSDTKPKRRYRCRICVEIFYTVKAFNEHRYTKHPDTAPKFVCDTCGCVLRTKTSLSTHMMLHSGQKFKCPQCDICFKVPWEISTHIRRVHKRERNFACHLCPQRCFNPFNLKVHLKSHYGIKSYQCHLCPNKYADKKSLDYHVSVTHEGLVGQYKCTYCSSKYNAMKHLRKHMLKVHGKKIKACKGSFTVVEDINDEKSGSSKNENSKERMVKPNRGRDMIVGNELQESEQLFPSVLQQL